MRPTTSRLDFVRILQDRAEQHPTQPAITFLHEEAEISASLTYAELHERVQVVAKHLQKAAAPGDRALLLYPPGLDYIAAFYACLSVGVIAVPLYPPHRRSVPTVEAIAKDCTPTVVCTTKQALSKRQLHAGDSPLHQIPWLASDVLGDPGGDLPVFTGGPDQLAYLQYTSGSTGIPKGVMIDHANSVQQCCELAESWRVSPESRMVSWLPHFHDFGQVGAIMLPVLVGCESVLMAPSAFVQRPIRWLQAISRYRGTHTAAPNFAFDLCVDATSEADRAGLDLTSLVLASNGAEPVRLDTVRRFQATFAESGLGARVVSPGYGLAEATLKVTSGTPEQEMSWSGFDRDALGRLHAVSTDDPDARFLVGCGPVTPPTELAIVDASTRRRQPDGQIGEVWVAGPIVARGYWGRPAETAETFGGRIEGETGGPYLRSGDLGFLKDGELYLCGRRNDLIIVNGTNHHPQDVERTVEVCHPAVRRGRTAAFSVEVDDRERVVVVVECGRGDRTPAAEVVAAVREAISRVHALDVTIAIAGFNAVPLTSSGKIQRRRCRADFLADRLPVVFREEFAAALAPVPGPAPTFGSAAEVLQHSIGDHVLTWIGQNVLESTALVDRRRSLTAHGVSSLDLMELHSNLEDWTGIRLPAEWMWDSESIADLAHLIAGRLTGAATTPALTEDRGV